MKECDKCKQTIPDGAIRCHHCTSWVTTSPEDGERTVYILDRGLILYGRFVAGVLVVFLVVGVFFFGYDLKEASEAAHDAKRDTETLKSETETVKSETETVKSETETVKSDTEKIKRETLALKMSTDAFKSETKSIKNEALEAKHKIDRLLSEAQKATTATEETVAQRRELIQGEIDSVLLQRLEGVLDKKQLAQLRTKIGGASGDAAVELIRKQKALDLIGALKAAANVNGGKEIIVALPLARVIELPAIRDRVTGSTVSAELATSEDALATAAASVILAVAPSAKVLAINVLKDGQVADSDILAAYATASKKGARVLCSSIGRFAAPDDPPSLTYVQAVKALQEKGIVVLCTAGNFGPKDRFSPGNVREALTIATTDNSLDAADFTGRGDWVDLAAPGVGILSLSPTGGTRHLNGGTFSVAICAGVAALMLSVNSELSVEQIEQILKRSAQKLPDNELGAGLVNAEEAVRQSKKSK